MATKITYNGPPGMSVSPLGMLTPGMTYEVTAELAATLCSGRWFSRPRAKPAAKPKAKAKETAKAAARTTAPEGSKTGLAVDLTGETAEVTPVDLGPPGVRPVEPPDVPAETTGPDTSEGATA